MLENTSHHQMYLNTPRLVADAAGAAVWRWDQQEPFGLNVADENPSGLGAFEFPLRFPGQYADKETNLSHNGKRPFDSALGRFPTADPLGLRHHLNQYSYANLNPLSYIDSTGEAATLGWCFGGPIACAAGVTAAVGSLIWAQSQMSKKKGAASSWSSTSCPDDRDDYCEKVRQREEALCEALAGPRYPGNTSQAVRVCKKAAFDRYVMCLQGVPQSDWPPLTGIDTPI